MKILGFKPKRIREWLAVIRAADMQPSYAKMLWMFLCGLPGLSRARFRRRMRTCLRCAVYDEKLRRCFMIHEGKNYGCGCATLPLTLFSNKPCWARERLGKDFGWD